MKIGVMSDIHNNIAALDRVLDHFQALGCGRIVCCGDIVGMGPEPEATVKRIMSVEGLVCVRGNHEDYLREIAQGRSLAGFMSEDEARYHVWESERLSSESKRFLNALPVSDSISVHGKKVYLTHYPKDGNGYLKAGHDLTLERCEQMFSDIQADIILFGHSHKFFDDANKRTRFINIRSLGCPAESRNIAHAGVLEISEGMAAYEQVALAYDVDSMITQMDTLDYPAKDEIKQIFYGL